jgi:hypothetical protein
MTTADPDPNASPADTPSSPADTPLLEVLRRFEDDGYASQFRSIDGGRIECLTCHTAFAADRHQPIEVVRLEGVSDPADMLMVVPLECPNCSSRGTLVANYGPEATLEDAEATRLLDRSAPRDAPDLSG